MKVKVVKNGAVETCHKYRGTDMQIRTHQIVPEVVQ